MLKINMIAYLCDNMVVWNPDCSAYENMVNIATLRDDCMCI